MRLLYFTRSLKLTKATGYIEEVIFPANVVVRYGDDKNWATFVSEAFGKIPFLARAPLSLVIRRGALSQLWARGTGRYSKPEIAEILDEAIKNLELKVGKHQPQEGKDVWYVYGGPQPTSLDVMLYSWLVCVLSTECNPVQKERILASGRLRTWIRELTNRWFPEYALVLELTGQRV